MKNKQQLVAIQQIHKLADEAGMCAFILCDEDLEMKEEENATKFTADEKEEIYTAFHDGLSEVYDEILENICINIIENR